MKLRDWRALNRLTMIQAAKRLGISQATISRIEGGKQRPDWATMEVITAVTDGAVTPNDFIPDSDNAGAPSTEAAV